MRMIKKTAVCAAVFLGMFVGSARAQGRLVAKVPFPFVVGGEQLPAGRYEVSDHGDGVLSILGMDNHTHAFAPAPPADGRDPAGNQPALVFLRYEHEYLLSQIWESRTEGRALVDESATSKHDERAEARPESVVLAFGLEVNGK